VAASPSVQELLPETVQGIPAKLRLLMEQATAGDEDRAAQ